MNVLTRDLILSQKKLKMQEVEVPEWEGSVFVRELSGQERDEFEEGVYLQKGDKTTTNFKNFRARLVVVSTCDAEGNRLFTPDDVEEVGRTSAAALERIYKVAEMLSGFRKKDVDELTKNS